MIRSRSCRDIFRGVAIKIYQEEGRSIWNEGDRHTISFYKRNVREQSSAPCNKSANPVRSMKGLYWTFESFASRCTYTAYKGRFAHYKEFLDGFQRKKKRKKERKKRKEKKEKVEAEWVSKKRTTTSFTNFVRYPYSRHQRIIIIIIK